jgi:hypothetical protein
MCSVSFLGGLDIISVSATSWAKLTAVTRSVPRSIVRISTVESGKGSWKIMSDRKGQISGILEVKVY